MKRPFTQMPSLKSLEEFFAPFHRNIVGQGRTFETPFGQKKMLYADWTATGRAYWPIEVQIQDEILPFFANTHTKTSITGRKMTNEYEQAKIIIKAHVHANNDDVLIFCGSGMTAAVSKLQRILGFRVPERLTEYVSRLEWEESERPVVFVTHMEHHSNQISWMETIATVEIIRSAADGNVDLLHLRELLAQYSQRTTKIAAVTACSNVTGIETPVHAIAAIMHEHGGLCFADYSSSAPYVDIDLHPERTGGHLDAIYFSFHKFLGGPGTPGVLIFNKSLYKNKIPDQPGGGTILYSNPWGEFEYISDVEQREDGGTPPILQGIKAAMCVRLKEAMGVTRMLARKKEMLSRIFERLDHNPQLKILGGDRERLGIFSFTVTNAHHNLIATILNDRFGIQARGGCSCAGTYGHWLLGISKARSHELWDSLKTGDNWTKPGWIRISLHPTMSDAEIDYLINALESTIEHVVEWSEQYSYDPLTDEYIFQLPYLVTGTSSAILNLDPP